MMIEKSERDNMEAKTGQVELILQHHRAALASDLAKELRAQASLKKEHKSKLHHPQKA